MNEYVLPNLFFLISTTIFLIALGLILPSFFAMDEAKFEEELLVNKGHEIESSTPSKDKY